MRFNIQLVIGKRCLIVLCAVLLACSGRVSAGNIIPGDSIGTEVVNGKRFILYRVEPKETLYSISGKYNISVAELVQFNPETEAGLKIGAILKIPVVAPSSSSSSSSSGEGKFHVVEKSETLFSIARQYGVTVAQLKEWNKLSSDAISLGERMLVSAPGEQSNTPARTETSAAAAPSNANSLSYAGKIVHTVESKETLFSIARMHDTTEEKIREWNKLSSDNISVGQKLIVGTAQGLPAQNGRNMAGSEANDSKPRDYKFNNNPVSITQIGDPSQEELLTKASGRSGGTESTSEGVRKITELGMAMVIVDTVNTKKYLALHRTAPVGTIMQVHNEMNNLSVFVRVVGKLPATGDNDKVLIKLSPKAFDKLGAYNDKFPVRLTYVP